MATKKGQDIPIAAPQNDEVAKRIQSKKTADCIIRRYDNMRSAQANFLTRWQECSDYILQHKGNIQTIRSEGENQTFQIFDTTAEKAAMVCAAGLVAQVTPNGEKWFRFTAPESEGSTAQDWLDRCTDRAVEKLHQSNFYLSWHEDCIDSSVFGSSLMFQEENDDTVVNFVSIPVGRFVWAENAKGKVDTVLREFEFTASQAVEKWGEDALPKEITKICNDPESKDSQKKFKFIHQVCPRKDGEYDKGQFTSGDRMPYSSTYVSREFCHVISESGYYEFPFVAGRFLKSNDETYGRSPGIQTMPEIKVLNRMERNILNTVELQANPPWIMPEDSAYRPDNRPGGITYVDSTSTIPPQQLRLTNNVELAEAKTEQKRQTIRSAFYVDMFQMLNNPSVREREKTAFEVQQMLQEKLVLFSPIFARMVVEKIEPMLTRLFAICARNGVFEEPPEDILDENGDVRFKVELTSRIALAIKASANSALAATMQMVTAMAELDQSVPMLFKWRGLARQVSVSNGIPAKYIRSDYEIDEMLASQQEAQEKTAAQEAMVNSAKAAKDLGPEAQRAITEGLRERQGDSS